MKSEMKPIRETIPLEEARQWALDGRINDGKTIIGLIRALQRDSVRSGHALGA